MADAHASGACIRTGVRVQIPFSAFFSCLSVLVFIIMERWPSLVRHRTRNPASGFCSRAGSNPVLSLSFTNSLIFTGSFLGHIKWATELLSHIILNFSENANFHR